MKTLKLIKENELAVSAEHSIYCDFCGGENKKVFTSSYDDNDDGRKCETQICTDCVKQLFKMI